MNDVFLAWTAAVDSNFVLLIFSAIFIHTVYAALFDQFI